jgi:hypothetical protein
MNASRGFEKRNRAEIGKAGPIGQECTWRRTVIHRTRDSSRVFTKESDGTPHSGSQRHSTTNSQFMYHFNRNLQ